MKTQSDNHAKTKTQHKESKGKVNGDKQASTECKGSKLKTKADKPKQAKNQGKNSKSKTKDDGKKKKCTKPKSAERKKRCGNKTQQLDSKLKNKDKDHNKAGTHLEGSILKPDEESKARTQHKDSSDGQCFKPTQPGNQCKTQRLKLKPMFHCDPKTLASGPCIGLEPQCEILHWVYQHVGI